MAPKNINFKLLSLNARGIRSFEKRKALFGWLMKDKSDICFLQESYSTPEVENIWKSQSKDLAIDWKKLYSLAFETTLDTKLREFQYKILNLIIFTNEKLHRFKMVDSPLCAFCNAEEESLEHLLYFCKVSTFFWKELLSWIAVEANICLLYTSPSPRDA